MVSGGILAAIALLAVIGPWISPNEYLAADFNNILRPPTPAAGHVFGTDDLGRDLFVRTMMGVQVTFAVALVASIVSLVIGVLYGATAGFVGGRVDAAREYRVGLRITQFDDDHRIRGRFEHGTGNQHHDEQRQRRQSDHEQVAGTAHG